MLFMSFMSFMVITQFVVGIYWMWIPAERIQTAKPTLNAHIAKIKGTSA